MFFFLNILILIVVIAGCISFIKSKSIKYIFAIAFSFFLNLQILSLYVSGKFVDYKFYTHANLNDIAVYAKMFKWYFVLSFLSIIFFIFFIFFIEKKLHNFTLKTRVILSTTSLILGFLFMSISGGIVDESIKLFSILNTSDNSELFEKSLNKLKLHNYIEPNETISKKGKNIIVISLESFEKGYLSNKLSHLTPNLRKLKSEWNYYDINQNSGSEWTSGSLYTSLTGFPAFFNTLSNQTFQNSYGTKINSISNVLKKAEYDITYLIGNSDFAGTEDMLSTYGFDQIIDYKDLNGKYNVFNVNDLSDNNIHDKDLFAEAKNIINSHDKTKNNFALFISTISTHFPDGIFDSRMTKHVSEKESSLEFMVASVDYMLGDFIQFLKKENLLENTIIYIYPDHLKMGGDKIFEGTGDRGLYMITNANKENIGLDEAKEIYQLDIPKMILNGSEVENNATFLTDYIIGDKERFISDYINDITSVNVNGLMRVNYSKYSIENVSNILKYKYKKALHIETKHYKEYVKDTSRFIAHAGGMINGEIYTNSLEALNKNYSKGFRKFELDILETSDGKFVSFHDWNKWKLECNYTGATPVSEKDFISYSKNGKFTLLTMEDINTWFLAHEDAILVTDKINEPEKFSSEFVDKDRLMMELFSLEKVLEGSHAGIKSVIVSENVIISLKKNRLGALVNMGIKDIAVSYRYVSKNVTFLKKIKSLGINTYVYHVNYDKGVDEEYIIRNEMDYIYGMYADKWNFK